MKEQLGAWFRRHHRLALLVSAISLAVGSALLTSYLAAAIPLMLAGAATGWLGDSLRERDDEDREAVLARAKVHERQYLEAHASLNKLTSSLCEVVEDWLQAIGVWASLDSEARVTLYALSDISWKRLARFSPNLSYMGSGRTNLPVEQGALHRAYVVGEYFIDNLPSFESDAEGYFAEHRRLGINKSVCRQFTMRSRSYCCFSFGGGSDRGRPYVLVFESTDPNGLDSEALRRILHSEAKRALVVLAQLVRDQ